MRNALVLTESIKSRMGASFKTAFWEVRSEPFGSRHLDYRVQPSPTSWYCELSLLRRTDRLIDLPFQRSGELAVRCESNHQAHRRRTNDAMIAVQPTCRTLSGGEDQLQECSLHETAKVLGISVAAAKARLFHARTALRRNKRLLLNYGGAGPDSHKRFFLRHELHRSIRSVGCDRLCFSKTKFR